MISSANLLRQRSVYHFTSITNLVSVLEHGLLSNSALNRLGIPVPSLGWPDLRSFRAQTAVPAGSRGTADDYIPLYFTKLPPMLLVLLYNKVVDEEDILFWEFPLAIVDNGPAVFTDAAIFPGSTPHFYDQLAELNHLDWETIDSPAWRMPSRQLSTVRGAELLIHRRIPAQAARRLIAWDEQVAARVTSIASQRHLTLPPVALDPGCYFFDPESLAPAPVMIGPHRMAQDTTRTVDEIKNAPPPGPGNARFANLEALRLALWNDLGCLPETGELIGLETDNRAHKEDVGAHTRRVVLEVTHTTEYQGLDEHARGVLEVAAFLHDIGKGPKSRWAANGGRQQIDFNHPIKALPMVKRILTQEVSKVDPEDARLICMLVAYHDIIGGVLFSGRKREELLNVIHSIQELDMLSGLSKADALAINPAWGEASPRDRLREEINKIIIA